MQLRLALKQQIEESICGAWRTDVVGGRAEVGVQYAS